MAKPPRKRKNSSDFKNANMAKPFCRDIFAIVAR